MLDGDGGCTEVGDLLNLGSSAPRAASTAKTPVFMRPYTKDRTWWPPIPHGTGQRPISRYEWAIDDPPNNRLALVCWAGHVAQTHGQHRKHPSQRDHHGRKAFPPTVCNKTMKAMVPAALGTKPRTQLLRPRPLRTHPWRTDAAVQQQVVAHPQQGQQGSAVVTMSKPYRLRRLATISAISASCMERFRRTQSKPVQEHGCRHRPRRSI